MVEFKFSDVLGRATAEIWGDLPRDLQEAIFEIATRGSPESRTELAQYLHKLHPKTVHPPRPSALV
jgi:hypothetical protein